MSAAISLAVGKAAPFVAGSVQDATPMQFVSAGAPFVVADLAQGAKYIYDVLGRLTQILFTNGYSIVYNYDSSVGNRTSVVTTL